MDVRQRHYQELKERVHRSLLNRLNLDRLNRVGRAQAEPEIRGLIVGLLDAETQTVPLSLFEREALITDVFHELFGLGPLESLLADPSISDILVNKANQIYIEREGKLEPTDLVFKDDAHLLRIIERIVSSVGRRIDESSPMVDARLQDGSRVNAIIPPLALDGPVLSIRRFRTDRLGAQGPGRAQVAHAADARLSAGVCLGAAEHPDLGRHRRRQDHVPQRAVELHLGSRARRHDRGRGRVDAAAASRRSTRNAAAQHRRQGRRSAQRQLVINALRMRPDRIVVGEVRGEEALDMLQAMNTGHEGSLTTIHANTPRDALYRLDTMVAMANLNIPEKAVRQQVASAIHVVVQLTRLSDGTRTRHGDLGDHRHGAGRHHHAGHLHLRSRRADA